jgi:hypothetical protein
MIFSAPRLRAIFSLVIVTRLAALYATAIALTVYPQKFGELDPLVSPVFVSLAPIEGAAVYTIILLLALVLILDSIPRTLPKWYNLTGAIYAAVLAISTGDLLLDLLRLSGRA